MSVEWGTPAALSGWDFKVAQRAAYAERRAAELSDRLGVDVKALRSLGSFRPKNRATLGIMRALREGLAVLDEDGFLRCPPGTANAMQFTNFTGLGCDVPAGGKRPFVRPTKVPRAAIDEAFGQLPKKVTKKAVLPLKKIRDREKSLLMSTPTIRDADFGEVVDGVPVKGDWREGVLRLVKRGGVTVSPLGGNRPDSGWAVARPGQGIRVKLADLYDEDGSPSVKGVALLHAYITQANRNGLLGAPEDRRSVGTFIGGWVSEDPDTGEQFLHLDITDVFPKDAVSREEAVAIGAERGQRAVADLDAINADDKPNMFVDAGGPGTDYADFAVPARKVPRAVVEERGKLEVRDEGPLVDPTRARIGTAKTPAVESDDPDAYSVENVGPEFIAKVEQALEEVLPRVVDGYEGPVGGIDGMERRFADLLELVTEQDFQDGLKWYPGAREMVDEIAARLGVEPWQAAGLMAVLSPGRSWDQNVWQAKFIAKMVEDNPVLDEEMFRLIQALRIADFETKLEEYAKGKTKNMPRLLDVDASKFIGQSVRDLMGSEEGLDVLALFARAYGSKVSVRDHGPDSKWRPDQVVLESEKTILAGEDVWEAPQWQAFDALRKSFQLLAAGPEDYQTLDTALGDQHKVRSFFNNILFPFDGRDSTIDVHMGSIGTGAKITSGNKEAADLLFSKPSSTEFGVRGGYPLFQIALRRVLDRYNSSLPRINAAREEAGLPPVGPLDIAQLQAILWVAHRRAPFGEGLSREGGALAGVTLPGNLSPFTTLTDADVEAFLEDTRRGDR